MKKLTKINLISNQKNARDNNNELNMYKSKNNNSKSNHSTFRNILELKNINEKDISVYFPKIDDIKNENEKSNNYEFSNYELNNLEYEDSLKFDHRKFAQIYWSILTREHIILFTYFTRNDFNLLPVKFARFIFLVCTDMALNVFFFSDNSMNKIFLTYGKYDFIQKIP